MEPKEICSQEKAWASLIFPVETLIEILFQYCSYLPYRVFLFIASHLSRDLIFILFPYYSHGVLVTLFTVLKFGILLS